MACKQVAHRPVRLTASVSPKWPKMGDSASESSRIITDPTNNLVTKPMNTKPTASVSPKWPKMGDSASESSRLISREDRM